jgi:hypothetical protein
LREIFQSLYFPSYFLVTPILAKRIMLHHESLCLSLTDSFWFGRFHARLCCMSYEDWSRAYRFGEDAALRCLPPDLVLGRHTSMPSAELRSLRASVCS